MKKESYGPLQSREIFHLEFLRWFARRIKSENYVLKGGVNLRFFFNSIRYSEDMDLDVDGVVEVNILKEAVLKILSAASFQEIFKPFGIEKIIPPDISQAKQTQTTQRFKIHLITGSGEDLFTKVEFSRRGFRGKTLVQPVSDSILREYRLPPLLVSHYDILSTIKQKIEALAGRSVIQARDIFDLYLLTSQYKPAETKITKINSAEMTKARHNLFEVGFEQFRDTVVSYLPFEEQNAYNKVSLWDEIKLKVDGFLDELKTENG